MYDITFLFFYDNNKPTFKKKMKLKKKIISFSNLKE